MLLYPLSIPSIQWRCKKNENGMLKIFDRKFNRRIYRILVMLYYGEYNRIQCRTYCKLLTQ